MKYITRIFKKLMRDETAQGATEYILLLVVVVAIAMLFRNEITNVVRSKLQQVSSDIGGFTGLGGN